MMVKRPASTLFTKYTRVHSREEQVGPLLFMLLMQELFFIAQKTAKSLHSLMKQCRIDSVPGGKFKIHLPSDLVLKKNTFPPEFLNTILITCEEIMSYHSSLSTRKDGCCSNRVVIARVDDKIIEIEIVRFRHIVM
jgi:hypothetical protein